MPKSCFLGQGIIILMSDNEQVFDVSITYHTFNNTHAKLPNCAGIYIHVVLHLDITCMVCLLMQILVLVTEFPLGEI